MVFMSKPMPGAAPISFVFQFCAKPSTASFISLPSRFSIFSCKYVSIAVMRAGVMPDQQAVHVTDQWLI
jgi:hypothetical protein